MPDERSTFDKIMDLGHLPNSNPGAIMPDMSQQTIDSIAQGMPINIENSNVKAPAMPTQQAARPEQAQKPQGDSTYVGQGINYVFRNWDINEAIGRSFDTTTMTAATGKLLGEDQVGYSRADLSWDNVGAFEFRNMSSSQIMGLSEQLVSHNILPGLKDDKGNALHVTDLSTDGKVINVLRNNYDNLQGNGIIKISSADAALLASSKDSAFRNAYDPLTSTITLTSQQRSILDGLHRYDAMKTDYRNFVQKQIHNISDERVWGRLSAAEKQETNTFFNNLRVANNTYKHAHQEMMGVRIEQAKLNTQKGLDKLTTLPSERRDINERLRAAQDRLKQVRYDNEHSFTRGHEEGQNGHQGRVDTTFRISEHALSKGNESGADFTATGLRSGMMKARGAVMLGRQAVEAGRESVLNNAQKQLNKAKARGVDKEKVDRLQKNVDDLKAIRENQNRVRKAERGNDVEEFRKARRDLAEAKDIYRIDKREAKDYSKDKRFEKREGRKGRSRTEIDNSLKNIRQRRAVKNQRRDNAHKTFRRGQERIDNARHGLKEVKMSLRAKVEKSKFATKARQSFVGRTVRNAGNAFSALRNGIMGVLKKLLKILLPIIIIVAVVFIVVIFVVGIAFAIFEMFVGDNGDKEKQTDAIEWDTANYTIVIQGLKDYEVSWQNSINKEAQRSAKAVEGDIRDKIKEAGVKLCDEFPLDIHEGETGVMLDEYDVPQASMGNYIQNIGMGKYRINQDLRSKEEVIMEGEGSVGSALKGAAIQNVDLLKSYAAYMFAGDDDSDSSNWTGRAWYELEKDKVNNRGTDWQGTVVVNGELDEKHSHEDEETRWKGSYSYQNWDPAAMHWVGENHKVRETPYSTTYQGPNGDVTGVITEELGGDNWLAEKPEIAIHYWHHDDLSQCDHVCYHGAAGDHDMGTSPGDCDNYTSRVVIIRTWVDAVDAVGEPFVDNPKGQGKIPNKDYTAAVPGHYNETEETHYFCEGHCPGHAVPIIDYQFIGKAENLAAFDGCPINKLTSVSDRWSHWWGEKGINLETAWDTVVLASDRLSFALFNEAVRELNKLETKEEKQKWLDEHPEHKDAYNLYVEHGQRMLEVRNEALEMSGESAWDHWDGDDIKWVQETLGDYKKGYPDGRELFKDWNINIGALQGGVMTEAEKTALLDKLGLSSIAGDPGGHNPAATTHALQAAYDYATSGHAYVWGGTNPNNGMDCSAFASWMVACYENPDVDPMSLRSSDASFGYATSGVWVAMSDYLESPSQIKPGSVLSYNNGSHGHVIVCAGVMENGNFLIVEENGHDLGCIAWEKSFDQIVNSGITHINNAYT